MCYIENVLFFCESSSAAVCAYTIRCVKGKSCHFNSDTGPNQALPVSVPQGPLMLNTHLVQMDRFASRQRSEGRQQSCWSWLSFRKCIVYLSVSAGWI